MKIIKNFSFLISLFLSSTLWSQDDLNLLELYKDLHSNPELSYKEEKTSKNILIIGGGNIGLE